MMKITVGLFVMMMSFFSHAITKAELLAQVNGMTNDQIWTTITTSVNGWSGFGKCRMQIANPGCPSCMCDYYFKSNIVGSVGHTGWPKNPASGDSTGCMQWSGEPTCWGGYTAAMCTGDVKQNTRAMLVDALQNSQDVCDLAGFTAAVGPSSMSATKKIAVTDSSKFIFVKPGEPCTAGKVLCGTTDIAAPIGNNKVFTKLNSKLCNAALGIIEKKASTLRTKGIVSTNSGAKLITCAQYDSLVLSTTELVNAKLMEDHLNHSWYGPNMAEVIPYLDYNPTQLNNLQDADVALFRAAVGQDRLPVVVKTKSSALLISKPELMGRGPAAIKKMREQPATGAPACTLQNALDHINTGAPMNC